MKKIVFFFPWKVVSGGPYYFCRLADALAETSRYEVYYADYYNSLSDDILVDFRVRKIPYIETSRRMEIFCDEPVTFIIPVYLVHNMPKLHPKTKIVLVNWHNECIPVLQKDWKVTPDVIQQFLKLAARTDSVCFCDITHWMAQQAYGENFKEQYVPVVIPKRDILAEQELVSTDEANVAILGRLSADKVYAAIDLVENLSRIELDKPINVHVIGEGEESTRFFERYYGENINIVRYGTLEINAALKVMSANADVLFAMGTSALDGASIGLPTYIMPNECHPFHCDKYIALFQNKGYALGWSVDQLDQLQLKYQTAEEIITGLYRDGKKRELGERCRQFCLDNYTSNLKNIEAAMKHSTLTYAKLQPLLAQEKTLRIRKGYLRNRIKRAFGTPVKKYIFLGIPTIILTKRSEEFYNFYLFYIPLFRFKKRKEKSYSVQPLLLVWIYKGLKKMFRSLRRTKTKGMSALPSQSNTVKNKLRKRIETKLANHEKIRVCLFEPRISCWKFGNLYRLLDGSGIFEPIVVVTPFPSLGYDAMVEYMDDTYTQLSTEGYHVIKGFDKETGKYLDIKRELDPDAVFYSMYVKHHFHENSYITKFEDIYSFLYAYGFDAVKYTDRGGFNFELQLKVTRYYMHTKIHKGLAQDNMDNHAANVLVTGSPQLDYLMDKSYVPKDVWKPQERRKKRVIWAPHHSFTNKPPYASLSAFLDLYDFMLEIAEKYKDSIQFAFKPHPMLKPRLIKLWGKRPTEKYYRKWETGSNTQFEDGAFIDLFLTSDAMILDSVSFMTEYTVTDKPAFFTYGKLTRFPRNRYGRAISKVLYENSSFDTLYDDVTEFIEQVVLGGKDIKKQQREAFINEHLLPEGDKSAAELIYEDMYRIIVEDKYIR